MEKALKLYSSLPNFKGKLWLGNKLFSGVNKGEVLCQLSDFKMSLNLGDRIQRRILFKKAHEPETEAVFKEFFEKASCFFDIGGNVGFFSLQALSQNPKLKVVAFEPLDANIVQFKKNLSLNDGFSDRITIKEVCLGDQEGTVDFLIPPSGECGWGTVDSSNESNSKKASHDNWVKIERPATTLDKYLESSPDLKPDVIKVDVEGSEYRVLKGALDYLKNNKVKLLCIELNEPTLKSFNTSSEEVIKLMSDLGYKASVLEQGQLKVIQKAANDRSDFNCFFTPI